MRRCAVLLQSPQYKAYLSSKVAPAPTPLAAINAASAVFNEMSSCLIRSYRLDQVLGQCSHTDTIVARQESKAAGSPSPRLGSAIVAPGVGSTAFSYIGFRNVPPLEVAKCLLLIPEDRRQFHTVVGRDKHYCDYYADIDLPTATAAEGEETLLRVLDRLDGSLRSLDFGKYDLMVLESNHTAGKSVVGTAKRSYHIHLRGSESCFEDYRAPRAISENINMSIGSAVIDVGCYHQGGSLRTAFSAKAGPTAATNRFLPLQASDSELQRRLREMLELPPDAVLERSLVTRDVRAVKGTMPPTVSPAPSKSSTKNKSTEVEMQQPHSPALLSAAPLRIFNARGGVVGELNKRGTKGLRKVCVDAAGQAVPRFLREDVKWLRYKMALEKLHSLPSGAAADYNIWVRVGLALHNFGTEGFLYREWLRFSMKCPEKFDRDACEKKWKQFGEDNRGSALHPDHERENWRRGYNYLTSTVWRSLGTQGML